MSAYYTRMLYVEFATANYISIALGEIKYLKDLILNILCKYY